MIHIITDTTACLPAEIARRYNIPVIPQIINFGTESFYEGVDIDIQTFMQRLESSGEIPKTAAPPPELFVKEFKRLVPTGQTILCIHPSSEVSGTVRSAVVAARDFPSADIRVLDTRLVASPLGTLVQLAAEWAAEGQDADQILARLENFMARARIYFMVETLDYLARGGRIGGAAHLLGSMLRIKPILTIRDGKVEPFERERTHKRGVARLKEIVHEQAPHGGGAFLSVLHAGVPLEGKALAAELGVRIDQPFVPVFDMPPAIVTHGGPGILGVAFFIAK